MKEVLYIIGCILLACAAVGGALYYAANTDNAIQTYELNSLYDTRYNECMATLPRNKICVLNDISLKIQDKE